MELSTTQLPSTRLLTFLPTARAQRHTSSIKPLSFRIHLHLLLLRSLLTSMLSKRPMPREGRRTTRAKIGPAISGITTRKGMSETRLNRSPTTRTWESRHWPSRESASRRAIIAATGSLRVQHRLHQFTNPPRSKWQLMDNCSMTRRRDRPTLCKGARLSSLRPAAREGPKDQSYFRQNEVLSLQPRDALKDL